MQTHPHLSSANFLFPSLPPFPLTHSLNFPYKTSLWLAQLSQRLNTTAAAIYAAPPPEGGPTELPPTILPFSDDSGALQTAASVFLTGAFALFLFRSLRRRAKRAKQMRFRSSGAKENMKTSLGKVKSPPSPDQAFLGAVIAAFCGVLLYKFTTTIEFALNRQTLSDNYSVRQITITIRTIINGLCYLATFVFGFNSLGLFLYSGQLALNTFVDEVSGEAKAPLNTSWTKSGDVESSGTAYDGEDQTSDETQKDEEKKSLE